MLAGDNGHPIEDIYLPLLMNKGYYYYYYYNY